MEESFGYLVLIAVATAAALLLRLLISGGARAGADQKRNLPPSPRSIPLIGHLHLLKSPRHLSIAALSKLHGPVVSLRLGSRPALIVSTPDAVEDILSKHDAIFANHPSMHAANSLSFDNNLMFTVPYSTHFRTLRRITAAEVLSPTRVTMLSAIRREELHDMVRRMARGCGEVVLKTRLFEMTYNMMTKMVAGKRFYGEDVEAEAEAREFREMIREMMDVIFAFNPRDFFPAVGWADLMGVERKVARLRPRLDGFLSRMVEERRRRRSFSSGGGATVEEDRTLVDVMLTMQHNDPETYTDDLIKAQIVTVLASGSDTMAHVLDDTMLMLLCHPEVMRKARDEIDANVERGRFLEESDLPRLPYLHCIVKEVMRMIITDHPPHASSEDCTIYGYDIPRGTMVFVDLCTIHRDPELWDEPMVFKPERFDGHGGGWRDGYKYFVFGTGRRACPGENLAVRMVPHAIALLIQCFDWDPMTAEEVDLSGLLGITKPNKKTVMSTYKMRNDMIGSLSKF